MSKTANKPFQRQRTPYNIILEAIYLYSSGLSLRQVAKELEKRGVKRSREAIRKWVLKLRKRPEKRESKKQKKKKPRPIKLSPESRVKRLPHIPTEKKLLKNAEKLYARIEKRPEPKLLLLKKPLKAKQALSLLSPKHLTSTAIPEWCALIKGKLSFREAVKAACREAEKYYIEESIRAEREKAWRPRKARWSLKKRSFLTQLIPQPSLRDLWPLAVKAASTASRVCGWSRKGRIHDSVKLLAALLLKYVPTAKSYRGLAEALKREKLSTGLRREAYPSKSTLFDVAHSTPLKVLLAAITVLYLQILALYAKKLGCKLVDYAFYAVDSTCAGFDSFAGSGRRLLKFAVLYWPMGSAIACVFSSARRLAELIDIIPRGAVLVGDSEFWCRSLLLACLRRGVVVAIKPKGKAPLGLKIDLSYYWARKLCEQVFAHVVKRRRVLYAKTGEGAVVLLLLLLAGCNLAVLWRRSKLLDMFACI